MFFWEQILAQFGRIFWLQACNPIQARASILLRQRFRLVLRIWPSPLSDSIQLALNNGPLILLLPRIWPSPMLLQSPREQTVSSTNGTTSSSTNGLLVNKGPRPRQRASPSTNGRLFEKRSPPLIPKPRARQPLMTVNVTNHSVEDLWMDLLSLLS
jgi:hypothetical protein